MSSGHPEVLWKWSLSAQSSSWSGDIFIHKDYLCFRRRNIATLISFLFPLICAASSVRSACTVRSPWMWADFQSIFWYAITSWKILRNHNCCEHAVAKSGLRQCMKSGIYETLNWRKKLQYIFYQFSIYSSICTQTTRYSIIIARSLIHFRISLLLLTNDWLIKPQDLEMPC